jgi:hypothetical protein
VRPGVALFRALADQSAIEPPIVGDRRGRQQIASEVARLLRREPYRRLDAEDHGHRIVAVLVEDRARAALAAGGFRR